MGQRDLRRDNMAIVNDPNYFKKDDISVGTLVAYAVWVEGVSE